MSEFDALEKRLGALIGNLSAPARRALASTVAKRLRASQQQNIRRQQAPDGTPFAPRKTQARKKKGRVKREMFAKLRTAKYMKAQATPDEAVVQFTGRVQRMARVHHYGLRDRPSRNGKEVQYDARPLLGLKNEDLEAINDMIIYSLTS
ncbi:phage virion morphogenesis protein [Pantoea brenneri]|uniref:phage virion morphogenesis protein n=1 Tax=Pantoea brenneri TaxID=472694 RepID=UPI00210ECA6E|nr:phage virion morphogenesis protein [Pantoea brenneri]MCQ5469353.1 phage virion morphogenesis protein [Pantoea brenneri]